MRRPTHGQDRCGRGALRAAALLTFLMALLAGPADANAAIGGGLKQLSGTTGCFSGDDPLPAGCANARALNGVSDVVTAPNGENVYVSSATNSAILTFDRNTTTGQLTQKNGVLGCVTTDSTIATNESCNLIAPAAGALTGPEALALSPDNKTLYTVTDSGFITSFNRADDGTLTFNETENTNFGLPFRAITVSPDGRSVYFVGPSDNNSAVVWRRRSTTAGATLGDLTTGPCYGGGCGFVTNQGTWNDVAVTPDGKELLLTTSDLNVGGSSTTSAVIGWDRATSGVDVGELTPVSTASRCVSNTGTATCQARPGFTNGQSLAVSGNGTVFALSQTGLITIRRDPSTNTLTPDSSGNCFGPPQSAFQGCTAMPGSSCCTAWQPARDVVATNDGQYVYVGTEPSSAPSIWGFTRSGANISRNASPLGCVNIAAVDGCSMFRDGNRVQAVSAAGDSRHVYAAGNNRVWSFAIDRPPVCQNLNVSTPFQTSVQVNLACSDPDGEALTFSKVDEPGRGTLGGLQGNKVTYSPFSDTTGADTFTYRAQAAGINSDVAKVTVNVGSRPSGGGGAGGGGTGAGASGGGAAGGAGGGGPALIPSTVTNNWLAFPKYTKVTQLSVNNLLPATTVTVSCKTKKKKQQKKGCAYKSKRFTTSGARARLNLVTPFKKKKMPVGTKITISVTVPGQIGKRFIYTTRKRKTPKKSQRCLPPGGGTSSCA